MKKILLWTISIFLLLFITQITASTTEEISYKFDYHRGEILQTLEEEETKIEGLDEVEIYKKLEIKLNTGEKIEVEVRGLKSFTKQKYSDGDKVILASQKNYDDTTTYLIISYDRQNTVFLLFFVFLILSYLISPKKTTGALLGLIFSFVIIFNFLIPNIVAGGNPIFLSIISATMIIPVSFYLSHGFNTKTHISIVSTIIALVITGTLATIFMSLSKITGQGSEEAMFINTFIDGNINISGLLLAGVIIGTLGVLDDITISQSAIVEQITEVGKKIKQTEIFTRAMHIGRDHMASMINTLVLVYAGASMPILIIFTNSNLPLTYIISMETITMEIIRTLVGTIGLISAIPITTLIATVIFYNKKDLKKLLK